MGVRAASTYTNTQQNALQGGTTVVVVFTTATVLLAADNAQVALGWMLVLTPGTSTTVLNLGILRGTTATAPPINASYPWSQTVTAGSTVTVGGWYVDMPGVAQVQYSLVLYQNAGSSASTFVDGCLLAFVL